ncbi:MAG: hypothetical protein ABIU95_02315 [Burkholderiales bacterium]
MKRTILAIALTIAAGGAFADQKTNVVVNGVFQGQVGAANSQTMSVGSISSGNTTVSTKVNANQLWQLQGGNNNRQIMQVGSVLATRATALHTDVTVTGAVLQVQGGSNNFQRARIGVIH